MTNPTNSTNSAHAINPAHAINSQFSPLPHSLTTLLTTRLAPPAFDLLDDSDDAEGFAGAVPSPRRPFDPGQAGARGEKDRESESDSEISATQPAAQWIGSHDRIQVVEFSQGEFDSTLNFDWFLDNPISRIPCIPCIPNPAFRPLTIDQMTPSQFVTWQASVLNQIEENGPDDLPERNGIDRLLDCEDEGEDEDEDEDVTQDHDNDLSDPTDPPDARDQYGYPINLIGLQVLNHPSILPRPTDEAYWLGYSLGFDMIPASAPSSFTPEQVESFNHGHNDGDKQVWADDPEWASDHLRKVRTQADQVADDYYNDQYYGWVAEGGEGDIVATVDELREMGWGNRGNREIRENRERMVV